MIHQKKKHGEADDEKISVVRCQSKRHNSWYLYIIRPILKSYEAIVRRRSDATEKTGDVCKAEFSDVTHPSHQEQHIAVDIIRLNQIIPSDLSLGILRYFCE